MKCDVGVSWAHYKRYAPTNNIAEEESYEDRRQAGIISEPPTTRGIRTSNRQAKI